MLPSPGRDIRRIVLLTGAGISAESGLQTFRDAGGLWEGRDPKAVATPEAFARDPELVHRFYNHRRHQLATVAPNAAHFALARLQREFPGDVFLVTQNVDDLHERAGCTQVCHMHGALLAMWCTRCDARMAAPQAFGGATPCPRCAAPGGLRPDVVWFGEVPYDMDRIGAQLSACDLFAAIGTSGLVYPAAGFVREARLAGAATLEVNLQASAVAGCFHQQRQGLATATVPSLVAELLAG